MGERPRAAYQSIVDREPGNALALIRLARARAANGEDVAALEALKAWFATGSASFQAAMTVPEFESLRADPRFTAIVEPHRPCNTPEFRQFDFWLGDWDVEAASAPGTVSRNLITRAYDGCTVREEYTTPHGYAGTSLNFYDATRKVWHQTWIDNQGGGLFLEGGLRGRDDGPVDAHGPCGDPAHHVDAAGRRPRPPALGIHDRRRQDLGHRIRRPLHAPRYSGCINALNRGSSRSDARSGSDSYWSRRLTPAPIARSTLSSALSALPASA